MAPQKRASAARVAEPTDVASDLSVALVDAGDEVSDVVIAFADAVSRIAPSEARIELEPFELYQLALTVAVDNARLCVSVRAGAIGARA
jgi:hypothetical protein